MGSSSNTATPVVTQQTKDPWSGAQPYISGILGAAQGLYSSDTGYVPWPGEMQAALDPQFTQGMTGAADIAKGSLGGTANVLGAQNLAGQMVGNYGLSPDLQNMYNNITTQQNPYLQGVINQQMNKVNSAMSGAGRYGSGSHDAAIAQAIAPTLAQDYMTRQQMGTDILNQGLQRAGSFSQIIPSLDQAQYQPSQTLMGLGQYMTDRAQQALAQQIAQYNAVQARPWEQLARYSALANQAGQLGGTQVTTSPGATQPSTLQRILGGGLAGAGLGSAIFPGIGTGVGAAAGGLMGLL